MLFINGHHFREGEYLRPRQAEMADGRWAADPDAT